MKVIMLKDVAKVGARGQLKEVADGFALNSLIPRGLAEQATADKVKAWDLKMKAENASLEARENKWVEDAKLLSSKKVTISLPTNGAGHLYKQLSVKVLSDAIKKETGIAVDAKSIIITTPIKSVGDSTVEVHLGKQKTHLKVSIVAE